MAKNKEKKYNFFQVILCQECQTVAEIPEPCKKCGNNIFETYLKLQEIK